MTLAVAGRLCRDVAADPTSCSTTPEDRTPVVAANVAVCRQVKPLTSWGTVRLVTVARKTVEENAVNFEYGITNSTTVGPPIVTVPGDPVVPT